MIQTVAVYCASSEGASPLYMDAASRLGRTLAEAGIAIVYGGGAVGAMGSVATAALQAGGRVTGVIPRFMDELEWGNRGVTELRIVDDMHQRKRTMLELADAVVALPGGCGTLEELLEAITWKRLGLYFGPVFMVNVNRFFDPCIALLNRSVDEGFMSELHRTMWGVVEQPEEIVDALRNAPPWHPDARAFARAGDQ